MTTGRINQVAIVASKRPIKAPFDSAPFRVQELFFLFFFLVKKKKITHPAIFKRLIFKNWIAPIPRKKTDLATIPVRLGGFLVAVVFISPSSLEQPR